MTPAGKDVDEATTEEVPRLAVVSFVHRDPILGGERPTVGVVVESGDGVLTVLPTELRYLQVAAGEVHVLTTADLDAG